MEMLFELEANSFDISKERVIIDAKLKAILPSIKYDIATRNRNGIPFAQLYLISTGLSESIRQELKHAFHYAISYGA